MQELATKVDLLIGGDPISSERRDELAAEIAGLREFLEACGLPLPSKNPTINIDAKTPLPYYVPGETPQLVVPPDASAQTIEAFYALHVLDAVHSESEDTTRRGVGRGLAEYFASSYADTPPRTVDGFEAFDSLKLDDAEAEADNPAAALLLVGIAWAHFAWTLRDVLAPHDADRALATAWIDTKDGQVAFERAFGAELVEVVRKIGGAKHADRIAGTLREHDMIS